MAFRNSLRNGLQSIYYRVMMPYWQMQFSPFIEHVTVGDVSFRFFYGTRLSQSWYAPIKPHAMTEYLWVQKNIDLAGRRIIDAGAHHGHYAAYLASLGGKVTAVEPLLGNAAVLTVNAAINRFDIRVIEAAISSRKGNSTFIPRSNGKIFNGVGITVPLITLQDADPDATIIKLDVEGAEFQILPGAMDMMTGVHVWIIEVHSPAGSASDLSTEFLNRGFQVSYLDRNSNSVVPFSGREKVDYTTTIFCLK